MRKSGPASKNFREFVGTFAGDQKALVGAPPLPPARLPQLAIPVRAMSSSLGASH